MFGSWPPFFSESRTRWLLALILAVLTLALFWPATHYGFINFDDDRYVLNNPVVRQGLTMHGIRWALASVYELWWSPLLWISYMADTSLFGPGPFGYHLTNVLLHAANVLLLFWTLFRMTGSKGRSFFAAALFAVHPLRIESVVWITERKDVLSGLFFFLCLLAHLRQVERPSALRRWLLLALMLLGLMAKSTLVVLPFLLLLLDYWPLRRARDPWGTGAWTQWKPLLAEKSALFALAFLFVALTLHTHGTTSENAVDSTLWNRLTLIAPNYWSYLAQIFWPAPLSLIHPPDDPSGFARATALLGLLALTVLFGRLRKTQPAFLVGWLWFLGGLFPVIRGIRFDELSAYSDRYTYLPGIGIALMLCWGAGEWAVRRKRLTVPLILLGLAALAACCRQSALRLPDWKDSPTMFSLLLRFAPADPHVNNGYGHELLLQGKAEEAMPYFLYAAAQRPKTSTAVFDYANALIQLGRYEEVHDWFRAARDRGFPDVVEISALSGLAYLGANRASEAIPYLRQTVRKQPDRPAWRVELTRALFEAGQPEAAQEEIRELQRLGIAHIQDFDSLVAHYAGSWQLGNASPSWVFFRNNLLRQPDNLVLLNNAAWLLATTEHPPAPPEEALRLALRAVALVPAPHPGILDTLAAAEAAAGNFEQAQRTAQQAIDLARQGGAEALAQKLEEHLAAYRDHRPWREPAATPSSTVPAGLLRRILSPKP